jgi:hypothetical protein
MRKQIGSTQVCQRHMELQPGQNRIETSIRKGEKLKGKGLGDKTTNIYI